MTNVPATYNAFPCNFARLSTDLSRQERRVIRRKHEREKYGLVANLNGCRHPIVRKIVEESGFKIDDGEDTKSAYLIWSDCFIAFERLLTLRPYQRVNHFPGMIEICRKDFLAKNYSRQAKMDPGEYDFFPRTWVLPHEYGTFLAYAKRNPHAAYILKPANGAMGHGIRIFTNVDSVPANLGSNGTYVLQEYITNPLLIDGYKFDLRVYVLITSCCPLRIFVYNEGLVRVSAEKYISPIEPNGESMYRHLTNYTLNKRHHQYIRCDDESTGSKRSFAFLDNYIQENLQSDPQIIWRRIRNLIVKTMIIGAPHINHAYRLFHRGSGRPTSLSYLSCDTVRTAKGCSRTSSCSQASDRKAWNMAPQRTVKNGSNSGSTGRAASAAATIASDRASIAIRSAAFEILGFDIMLDRNLRPWLIEVNRSPSFGCDQELDVRVKSGLLRDALHLINIRPSDKQMAEEAMKMRSIRRLLSASPSQVLLSSVSQDSIPLHHISPKLVSSASNKAKKRAVYKTRKPKFSGPGGGLATKTFGALSENS
uniref:Tubulin polyglutamylase TTLL7 n=1 Tax=Schistocephalus solidus TaxID=70667 RepID=A0A0X3NK09_SCHSO